ncbi:hypothetical protein SDC9_167024 [bioreactor metagenome]|uniref:Uncharacterized protein n=1 Tax=bioreactor metagenome TaxID=1076179 RepID=A0A645G143_9ZZZZ
MARADVPDNFRLCKHRAQRADGQHLSPLRQSKQRVNFALQPVRHNLHEFSRPGGALVVHQKVVRRAVADMDGLGVLPAHVDHRAGGKAGRAAGCKAGDFRNLLCRVVHRTAAIAGGDDRSLLHPHAPFQQAAGNFLCRFGAAPAGGEHKARLPRAQNGHLGGGGADVDSDAGSLIHSCFSQFSSSGHGGG